MRTKALVALLAALVMATTALAKGPPQKVTISGGDLPEEIEITGDEATLNALAMLSLEVYETRTSEAPESISGEGYLITRFYEVSSGRFVAFDELRYYPDPDGGSGYIHYLGIVNGSSEYDGDWFRASASGEAALRSLMNGVEIEAAETTGIVSIFLHAIAAFAGAR